MDESQVPNPPAKQGFPADDLGRSYAALLDHQAWEVDAVSTVHDVRPRPAEVVPPASPPSLEHILEALLFVGGPCLTAARAGETIRGLTGAQFTQGIDNLNRTYRRQNRPYSIRAQEQGYVLALRPRYKPVLEKLYGGTREARLSPAAIDVLALVAYRQPASKQEVDSLRGAESGALLRQLVRRGLIAVVRRADASQREVAYGTTARFLDLFGLTSLEELPQTQDLQMM